MCLSWLSASAEVISTIKVLGNNIFSTRQVKEIVRPHEHVLSVGVERLLNRYRDEGYLLATVTIERRNDGAEEVVILRIDEGTRIEVGALDLGGYRFLSRGEILGEMDTRPGKRFDEVTLEMDMERLLRTYEENGFPYARIDVALLSYAAGGVHLSLKIDEGPRVRVGEIEVLGNRRTRDRVVLRETRIARGDLYNQRAIDRAQRRIEGLGLFRRVDPIQVVPMEDPGQAKVIISVEEKPNSSAEGILGYAPGAGDQEEHFTGKLSFSSANIAGTGRRVRAGWERLSPQSSELFFRYEEPWAFGLPLSLGIELEQTHRQDLFVRNRASLFSQMPLAESLRGGVHLGGEKILPDSAQAHRLARSTRYSLGVELSIDGRDRPNNTRRGGNYRTFIEYGRKRNYAAFDRSLVESARFEVDVEYHLPTFRRQLLFAGLHIRQLRSDEEPPPLSDRFFLGGAKTLRGYREEEFQGSGVAWVNLEYRLLLSISSRVFAFLDVGHYRLKQLEDSSLVEVSGERVGYGFGIRLESKLGMVGVDYGLGRGDHLTRGKVHLGLENSF